jgi:Family of unknown function (DUF5681)
MADHDDTYQVGYRKPPTDTRFGKGQSGNPKGRPKGSLNLATIMNKVGRRRIKVKVNGCTKTMTTLEAVVTQESNKALSGDGRAAKDYLNLHRVCEDPEQTALPPAAPDERDKMVMETIAKRIRQSEGPEPESETGTAATDSSPEEK